MHYDDIIVGGGSAGAVLAARLSEEPARRVLLVEAGPDYPTLESTPADLRNGWRMSLQAHDWGMTAEAVPGRTIPYPRARVIGGSSAVNATIALRGVPADYDEWAALGNDEWSWAKVLPHFRRLEDDPEGAGELHGRGGPITIRRWQPNEWIPIQRAFFEVCRRLGFPEVTDHNHPAATGVGPFPQSRRDRLRVSTAIAYLLPARHRPNLTIRPNTLVNRITVADDRAVGVDIGAQGRPAVIRGRRITLAAGAIGSPAILLRSGIGPKAALADLGIDPVTDLPGVGAGLADHPVTRLLLVPKPGSGDSDSPLAQVVLRYTAPGSASSTTCSRSCSATSTWPASAARQRWQRWAHRSRSGCPSRSNARARCGRLELASTDPRVQPRIQLNFAANPQDVHRLVEGVRLAWHIAHQPEIARHVHHVALLSEETVGSDTALAAYVRATVSTQFHPCGTAPMGPREEAMAVVDQYCRLRTIPNLRVVDASVMPTIPRANINLTCIMIGEHVADWMRDEA